jgi:hypothetical protein
MDVFAFTNYLAEEAVKWFRDTESTRDFGDVRKMMDDHNIKRLAIWHLYHGQRHIPLAQHILRERSQLPLRFHHFAYIPKVAC